MTRPNTTATIDWEATMTATERDSRYAAKMTERAVAALSEALDNQRRHSQQLTDLEQAVKAIAPRPTPIQTPPPPFLPENRSPQYRPLPLILAFVAGAACAAAFITSW